MVKKIVALAIALVLMLAVPMYSVITRGPASPIEFGAGDGESQVIENPAQIKELLESIPSIEAYLTTDNILTVNPNFKTFTMVENGSVTERESSIEYRDETVLAESSTSRTHVLEMCFAVDGLYYHAVGQQEILEDTYLVITNDSGDQEVDYDDYRGGTRTVTSYDIEIYYSSTKVLLKFNKYSIKNEERDVRQSNEWRKVEEDEDSPISQTKVLNAFSKGFGKWMELVTYTDAELYEKLGVTEDTKMEDLSEEKQLEIMTEYMVYQIANQFATLYIEDTNTSTQLNMQYLGMLSGYLTDNADTSFDKNGNRHVLKDDSAVKLTYITALGISPSSLNYGDAPDVSAYFTVNSDTVEVSQNWNLDMKTYSNYSRKSAIMNSLSTFKNVGNTVVKVKDTEVKSVYDTLKKSLYSLVEEYVKEESN